MPLIQFCTGCILQEEVGALTTRLSSDCQAIVRCLATNINVAVRNGMQCIGKCSCFLCNLCRYHAAAPCTVKTAALARLPIHQLLVSSNA
jgi:hypothetical protein